VGYYAVTPEFSPHPESLTDGALTHCQLIPLSSIPLQNGMSHTISSRIRKTEPESSSFDPFVNAYDHRHLPPRSHTRWYRAVPSTHRLHNRILPPSHATFIPHAALAQHTAPVVWRAAYIAQRTDLPYTTPIHTSKQTLTSRLDQMTCISGYHHAARAVRHLADGSNYVHWSLPANCDPRVRILSNRSARVRYT
jgi:hypothetical protein